MSTTTAAKSTSTSIASTPPPDGAFKLTERQEEARRLLAGPQRHTCLVGGARSGKTFLICRQTMVRALKAGASRHAVLRYRHNAVIASIWHDTLPKMARLCFPEVKLTPHRQDGFYQLPNKSQIWLSGLDEKDRVEKVLGQEYATVYLNECSQIPYSSVLVARTRAAQNIAGLIARVFYDLNPVGKGHYTQKLFGDGVDPQSLQPLKNPQNFKRMFLNPVDNRANLTQEFLDELDSLPDRQRKRFYLGQYVDEIDGALWTIETLERCRCGPEDVPQIVRVVVAIDPSGTSGEEDKRSDAIGIIAAGLGVDGRTYVLEDATCQLPPAGWGYRAWEIADRYGADCLVAEINFGGEMVKYVLESTEPQAQAGGIALNARFKMVTASRGKAVRAEPISALYEKSLVRHVGRFAQLEDQMLSFSTAGYQGERSPDRADALVWAISELAVGIGTPAHTVPASDLVVEPMRRTG